MSIKFRLMGSVAMIFLIVVAMFGTTWVVTSSQKDDSLVINLAGRQRMLSQKLAKETLAYGTNPSEVLKKQIANTSAVFEATLNALRDSGNAPLTLDPNGAKAPLPKASEAVHAQLTKVKGLWGDYKNLIQDSVASGSPDVAKINKDSVVVLKTMNAAVVMMQGESESRVSTLLIMQSVCIGVGIILVLIVIVSINSRLTTPLISLQTYAGEVAGGDLDAHIEGRFTGELESLKTAIETMVDNIRKTMADVEAKGDEAAKNAREASKSAKASQEQYEQFKKLFTTMKNAAGKASDISQRVATSVTQLAASVDQVNHGTDIQRDRMSETATAMEEMNATVLEVAQNAASAAQSATEARDNAQVGADGVRAAVVSFDGIKTQILDLNASMGELGEQAISIGNIMDVVTDIADQTNLLALNAAIEAARAGEAGRGFAVVADEVRKLAEKTMAATKEVGDAVQKIQMQARDNIKAVETSVEDIVKSTEAANESGQFMTQIVTIVGETAGQVESIATASEEQSAASEEINQAVADVTHIASETAQGMTEAARALEAMAAMAGDLDNVIRDMSGDSSALLNKEIKTLDQMREELEEQGLQMSDRSGLKAKDSKGMMQWTDDLSVNIRWVDEQHLKLVDLINSLHQAMHSGRGKEAVVEILGELKQYTVFHFGNEEEQFETHGYPEEENHIKAHQMFVDKVIEFEEKIMSGKAVVTMEVMDFLKDWLIKHIKVVDAQYSSFFNKKGIY